jgi:DNA-binding MarR family transcriptional regulator
VSTSEATVQQTVPSSAFESVASDPQTLRELGLGIAATCAGFNLRRASRAVTQHFDHALAPVGLRTTQFTLLGALAIAGPVSTNELAVGLVMDRTTLTRNLRLLRDGGLVETQPGRSGREVRFTLSDEGRDALARAIPVWREAQGSIEAAFGEARWPKMVVELDRLVRGTLALADDAGRFGPTRENGAAD